MNRATKLTPKKAIANSRSFSSSPSYLVSSRSSSPSYLVSSRSPSTSPSMRNSSQDEDHSEIDLSDFCSATLWTSDEPQRAESFQTMTSRMEKLAIFKKKKKEKKKDKKEMKAKKEERKEKKKRQWRGAEASEQFLEKCRVEKLEAEYQMIMSITSKSLDQNATSKMQLEDFKQNLYITSLPKMDKEGIEEFWKMIYREQITLVYLLVPEDMIKEAPTPLFKLQSGDYQYIGEMFINNRRTEPNGDPKKYTIEVLPEGNSDSVMCQVHHHTTWPQLEQPPRPNRVIKMIHEFLTEKEIQSANVCVVSVLGAARACSFIGSLLAISQLNRNVVPNISEIMKTIKKQRPGATESFAQYTGVYVIVLDYIARKRGSKSSPENAHINEIIDKLQKIASKKQSLSIPPLSVDPPVCTVPAAGGSSTHKLVNGGANKLVFKIKSSNNSEYRITPVSGFIDPSGFKDIVVTRLTGVQKEDKLEIYFAPAPAGATDARAAFTTIQSPGSITIPLSAT